MIITPTAAVQEMMDESVMMEKGKMEIPKTAGPSPSSLLLPATTLLALYLGLCWENKCPLCEIDGREATVAKDLRTCPRGDALGRRTGAIRR